MDTQNKLAQTSIFHLLYSMISFSHYTKYFVFYIINPLTLSRIWKDLKLSNLCIFLCVFFSLLDSWNGTGTYSTDKDISFHKITANGV